MILQSRRRRWTGLAPYKGRLLASRGVWRLVIHGLATSPYSLLGRSRFARRRVGARRRRAANSVFWSALKLLKIVQIQALLRAGQRLTVLPSRRDSPTPIHVPAQPGTDRRSDTRQGRAPYTGRALTGSCICASRGVQHGSSQQAYNGQSIGAWSGHHLELASPRSQAIDSFRQRTHGRPRPHRLVG
jgi:hypothetical protein